MNRRAIGLLLLVLGCICAMFTWGLILSFFFWIIGTMLFAKSYLER